MFCELDMFTLTLLCIVSKSRALVSCANGFCYYITPICYLFIMSDFRTLPSIRLSSFYYFAITI